MAGLNKTPPAMSPDTAPAASTGTRSPLEAARRQKTPRPTGIVLHARSRVLEVSFEDGQTFRLPFEYLRVYSPSAEVQGHGPGQEVLQVGKQNVEITTLEPIGNYAVKPTFSDGHVSGIYSWDVLYALGSDQDRLWAQYLAALDAAGASRLPEPPAASLDVTELRR